MKKFLIYGLSNEWGGVEAIVLSMVKNLSDTCIFDIVQSIELSSYEDKFTSKSIRFVHIPAWGSNRKGFSDGLKDLLINNRYDYVWINSNLMANRTVISVTKKYSNAKIITHSHGSSFEGNNKLKRIILLSLHKMNKRYYYNNIDYPCMCSRKSGIWFYGINYMSLHYVHYVKNGIDTDKYKFDEPVRSFYREQLGLKNDFVLFHAGRLTEVKNQRKILSVFADAIAAGVDAKLLIAGDGELRDQLEAYSNELGISDKVSFLGNRHDIDKLYQVADVMLLPSFHEGFPVTLTEAQTSGLPCLVSDRVSDETNITGLVTFLSIDGDNSEWVGALQQIERNRASDRSKSYLKVREEGFDIKTVCDNFINYIK